MIEKMLLLTKDNYPIVFNLEYTKPEDKADKVFKYKSYISDHTYNEVLNEKNLAYQQGYANPHYRMFSEYDEKNTAFLEYEVSPYSFYKQRNRYKNETENNTYNGHMEPLFKDVTYGLSSDDIPEYIKNLGFEISYHEEEYNVCYNTTTKEYEIKGDYKRTATIDAFNRKITIYRNHYKLDPPDKNKLNVLIDRYLNEKSRNPSLTAAVFSASLSDRDKSLFEPYAFEKDKENNRLQTLHHEVKHLMNAMFYTSICLKNTPSRLSLEDCYKLCVEDERSAYLSQIIRSVNEYLKKGDMNDFSMFDSEADWLVDELTKLPSDAERKDYVRHFPNLIKGEFKNFAHKHHADYEKNQFSDNLQNMAWHLPVSGAEDASGELYQKIRRQYFLYEIYNPDSGKTEPVSLEQYIDQADEVEINQNAQNAITIADGVLQKRQADYKNDVNNGEIDARLIDVAKQMIISNAHQPRFIRPEDLLAVATYQSSSATNEKDDKAGWSDELQKYWQKQDGYQPIAKTNQQYTFALKGDIVQYTSPQDVNLSPQSQYETFVKLLDEPTNKHKVINFAADLSLQQALRLYVACVAAGRKMKGNVPTDLSALNQLTDIPAADVKRAKNFAARTSNNQRQAQRQNRNMNVNFRGRER